MRHCIVLALAAPLAVVATPCPAGGSFPAPWTFDEDPWSGAPYVNGEIVTGFANGIQIYSPVGELGTLHLGPAIFDSTPGVNTLDPGLWSDTGNMLIVQSVDSPDNDGTVFDVPNAAPSGGTIIFELPDIVAAFSLALVGMDEDSGAIVTLTDTAGLTRTYDVPPMWTETAGIDTLMLTTLNPQAGSGGGIATAWEDPGFSNGFVVGLTVEFHGPGGLDDVFFVPAPGAMPLLAAVALAGIGRRRRPADAAP